MTYWLAGKNGGDQICKSPTFVRFLYLLSARMSGLGQKRSLEVYCIWDRDLS
jgi:hypothetical protein